MLRVATLINHRGRFVLQLRTRFFFLITTLAATVACADGGGDIVIGMAGPFSQARGQSMRLAAELAVREINAAGGVRGRPLALVFGDDSASAEPAVAVAEDLYAHPGLVAVIGHLTSGATLAAAPVYNGGADPVAAISPSASNPRVSDAGPWTFRICPTDLLHGSRLADWVTQQLGARRAAILYRNDDYGRGIREIFVGSFLTAGGDLVSDDPYLDDLPSFEPYLSRIGRRGGAEALLLAGTRAGAERILPLLDSLNLRNMAVLGGDGIAGIEQDVPAADGVYISTAYLPDRPGAANDAFVRAYRAAYDGALPDHRGAGAYDIVYLLARVVDAAGAERQAIRDYLAGVGSASDPFEGVTGRIAFDEHGDVPDKDVIIGVVRGGRLVTAEGQ